MRTSVICCAFAALLCGSLAGLAQDRPDRARPHRRAPLQVEVTPSRLYRQCTDWYVIEHRPAGDTVVPRMRCRWAVQ